MTVFVNDIIRIITGGLGGGDRPQRPDGLIAHTETAQGNTANTTDDVLCSLPIPAALLNTPGCNLELLALGHFAANGNNKQVKVWFGPDVQTLGAAIVTTNTTVIGVSGVVTTNNGGWQASAEIVKTGAYKSNTQVAQAQIIAGATHTGTAATVSLTKDETVQQYVTVTGASGTTGAANDVTVDVADVFVCNGG